MRAQLTTIAETAEFNGKNLITAGATDLKVLSTIEGSTITVSAQSLDPTTLLIHTATLATANSASQARIIIDTAIASVSKSLASLGSVAKHVDIQGAFISKLMDIMKQGMGNLVDATWRKRKSSSNSDQAATRCSGLGHRQRLAAKYFGAVPIKTFAPNFVALRATAIKFKRK